MRVLRVGDIFRWSGRALLFAACLFAWSPGPSAAVAQVPIQISPELERQVIRRGVELGVDEAHGWTVNGVLSGAEGTFAPIEELRVGITSAAVWARFELRNPGGEPLERLLEFASTGTAEELLVVLQHGDGRRDSWRTGERHPMSGQYLDWKDSVVPLQLEPGASVMVLVRLIKNGESAAVRPLLWEERAFVSHVRVDTSGIFIWYGLLVVMAAYHLLLYAAIRDRSYLYYVGFILSTMSIDALAGGNARCVLFPELTFDTNPLFYGGLMFFTGFWALFTRTALESHRYAPRLTRFLDYVGAICPGAGVALCLAPSLPIGARMGIAFGSNNITQVVCLTVGILAMRAGFRPARVYVASYGVLFVCIGLLLVLVTSLVDLGPTMDMYSGVIPRVGMGIQLVLFGLVLAQRINTLQGEVRVANERTLAEQGERIAAQEKALAIEHEAATTLQERVDQRTRELSERTEAVKRVLDNVGQGFLTLTSEGKVEPERSAIVDEWLGCAQADQSLWDYTSKFDREYAQWLELNWMQLGSPGWDAVTTMAQLPERLALGERTLGVQYRPLFSTEGELERVVVVLTDITSELAHARTEQAQREMLDMFLRISRDRTGLEQFIEEGRVYVGGLSSEAALVSQTRRAIHTLKGTSLSYGLASLSELCHRVEGNIFEAAGQISESDLLSLRDAWHEVEERVASLLDAGGEERLVRVARDELQTTIQALNRPEPDPDAVHRVQGWLLDPVSARLSHLSEIAAQTAQQLGKPQPLVTVSDGGLRLCSEAWRPIWANLVHVIRNAVYHGIETPDLRLAADKASAGQLWLQARLEGSTLVLEVRDDGAGIDWEGVAEHAREQGLPSGSRVDLERALCSDGLSTAGEFDGDVSGRGVGMGAMLQACQAVGGQMEIESTSGQGSCFRFRIPVSDAASVWEPLRSVSAKAMAS